MATLSKQNQTLKARAASPAPKKTARKAQEQKNRLEYCFKFAKGGSEACSGCKYEHLTQDQVDAKLQGGSQ